MKLHQLIYIHIFGAFTELQWAIDSFIISVCLSVRPHAVTSLPLDGFS